MPVALALGFGYARLIVNLLVGLAIVAFYFPFASTARRASLVRWWSRGVLHICKMRLQVRGVLRERGTMLLLNHVSWLDIYVVNACGPARFVAKSEIRRWPLFGFLAHRTGTLFLERGRRHAVHRLNQTVADLLRAGDLVGVFPEGTTSDGADLLPFHANLIQGALDAGVPVQPVALRYRKRDGSPCREVAIIGETSLFESIKYSLLAGPVTVRLDFLEPIETHGRSRHDVAAPARRAIAVSLGLDVARTTPGTGPDLRSAPR